MFNAHQQLHVSTKLDLHLLAKSHPEPLLAGHGLKHFPNSRRSLVLFVHSSSSLVENAKIVLVEPWLHTEIRINRHVLEDFSVDDGPQRLRAVAEVLAWVPGELDLLLICPKALQYSHCKTLTKRWAQRATRLTTWSNTLLLSSAMHP